VGSIYEVQLAGTAPATPVVPLVDGVMVTEMLPELTVDITSSTPASADDVTSPPVT
jgi:hypothetical protein